MIFLILAITGFVATAVLARIAMQAAAEARYYGTLLAIDNALIQWDKDCRELDLEESLMTLDLDKTVLVK